MNNENMKIEDYLAHIKARRSVHLYHLSRRGLELFFEFLQQDPTTVLKDAQERSKSENFNERNYYGFKIEEFYKWLMKEPQNFSHNSARVYSGAVESFFRFYNISNLEVSGDLHKVVSGMRVYVPTVAEFRKMYAVGGLRDRVILSLGLDRGWRPEDFLEIKKNEIDLNAAEVQPTGKITGKELEPAYSFVSMESLELLKLYIPTLKTDNAYLFPNGNGGHISETALNDALKSLIKKAQINTGDKAFTFYGFRKRLLSQAIDAHVDPNAAKLITGKAVDPALLTYVNSADFKAQFIKLRDSMRLSETFTPANHDKISMLEEKVGKLSEQNAALLQIVGWQNEELERLKPGYKERAEQIRKLIMTVKKAPTESKPAAE